MNPKQIVQSFFEVVRSGREPDRAPEYLTERVLAHQVLSEARVTVERTPQDYADHVRAFQAAFGSFTLSLEEVLADGDRVFVRWCQEGHHVGEVGGYPPTGQPIVERASAVYRVEDGKIAEYWIQIDRAGMEAQLREHAGT